MSAAPNLFLGERRKETFHEIEPRSAGGREVNMKTWTLGKPAADRDGLVGAVVVQNQMHVEIASNSVVNGIEELTELHAAMPPVKLADHRAGLHIESGK